MKRLFLFLLFVLLLGMAGGNAHAQRVTDGNYATVANIRSDGTIQDAGYRTIGHIRDDGTVQDANYRTVGHIRDDGTVQDANYRTIGHAPGIPRAWAAWFFFF